MTEDTRWNDLIAKSQGQPVEFVIVTDEPPSNMERILRERPLRGWIGLDPKRSMAQAFGIQLGEQVIIVDTNGMIAGYTHTPAFG